MIQVLVIDDEPAVRLLLQKNLEFAGFDVATAEDGATGLASVREGRPDVVVLDLMMPRLDGFEVLRQLSVDGESTVPPVVVLTALSDAAVKERCYGLGAASVMTKPFDPSALATEVARVAATERPARA